MQNRDKTTEIRDLWNSVARDWQIQVGSTGDLNRILNSDPVLWSFAGDVAGRNVLDAGCGTGYLSQQLKDHGAHVVGVDLSERMLDIARKECPGIDFRLDSCSDLRTLEDAQFDLVIANYVLMDTPDLHAAIQSFYRVLKPGGAAVLVFLHPCFPQGRSVRGGDGTQVTYQWDSPYFEPRKFVDPPWGHFRANFIWFHRPLSDYWKAFRGVGFLIEEFEEPRLTEDRFHLAPNERMLNKSRTRPYSVAFKLRK